MKNMCKTSPAFGVKGKEVPSKLFSNLLQIKGNRWDTIKAYATTRTKGFKEVFGNGVVDENGEPKLLGNSTTGTFYFEAEDGSRIPVKSLNDYEKEAVTPIRRRMGKFLLSRVPSMSVDSMSLYISMAFKRGVTEMPVKDIIDGSIALQSKHVTVKTKKDNPVQALFHIFNTKFDMDVKSKILAEYGIEDINKMSKEDLDEFKYQFALDYVEWKKSSEKVDKKESKEVMNKLKPFVSEIYKNSEHLLKFFEAFDIGVFTEGNNTYNMSSSAADFLLHLIDDFTIDKNVDTISQAVQRYDKATTAIRKNIKAAIFNPIKKRGVWVYLNRDEAELFVKMNFKNASLRAERALLSRYGSVTPDPKLLDENGEKLYQAYAELRTTYENYDKLVNIMYPRKTRKGKEIDEYTAILESELEALESELPEGTERNINEDVIGAENFNAERSQSPVVKDFLATINKPILRKATNEDIKEGKGLVTIDNEKFKVEKQTHIKPRYAYLLAGKLLKGLEYENRGTFFKELFKRAEKMGGKNSDAYRVAEAIQNLEINVWKDIKYKTVGKEVIREKIGLFVNENYFEPIEGAPIIRRKGEATDIFYKRIMDKTGLTNQELAVSGKVFVHSDTFVSLLSHFSSLKEADYHFFTSKEENFQHEAQYRRGKTQGIHSAVKNTILQRMIDIASETEMVDNKPVSKLTYAMSEALKEEDIYKDLSESQKKAKRSLAGGYVPYIEYRKVYRFLEVLGLKQEAAELKLYNVNYSKIIGHFVHMQERIEKEKKKVSKEIKKYDEAQKALSTLTDEQVRDAKKRVHQVRDNERAQKKKEVEELRESRINKELSTSREAVKVDEQLDTEAAELTPEQLKKQKERAEMEALTLEDLTPKEKIVYNAMKYKVRPEMDIRGIVNSIATDYSDILTKDNDSQRPSMIFSKDNTKKYTLHNSSNAWKIVQKIVDAGKKVDNIIESLPFLKSEYYRNNLFVSGKNRIYGWEDYDFSRAISYNGITTENSYKDERFKSWFDRVLNGQFIDTMFFDKTKGTPVYSQPFPTISNRPTSFSVKIRALSEQGIKDGIEQTIVQMQKRKGSKHTKFDPNSTTLFEVLAPYLKETSLDKINAKKVAQEIYDNELNKMSMDLAKVVVDARLPLHSNFINPGLIELMDLETRKKAHALVNAAGGRTQATRYNSNTKSTEYAFTAEQLAPIFRIFVGNHYVNSYHLTQLVVGDPAYFKNAEDIVKRSGGAHSPGVLGTVAGKAIRNFFGMNPTFNVIVAKDLETNYNSFEDWLRDQGVNEEDIEGILGLYPKDGFEESDGFGVMLPRRRKELSRGFGSSYGVTHISKPAHYEIMEDGRPIMLKYSSLELTDELVAKYPSLNKLRKNLEILDMDELVFNSAVKAGAPNKLISVTDLMIKDVMLEDGVYRFEDGEVIDMEPSTLTLSNRNYRLQHNPYHNLESTTANPTQLSYFLNVMGENTDLADRVYSSMGSIFARRLRNFTDGGFREMKQRFIESLKGAGNERILEYVRAGISMQFPGIDKEAFTKIASMFKKNIIQIRFGGQKLVAQADVGITKQIWDEQNQQWVTTNRKLRSYVINKGKENERRVSETLIPRGALPPAIEEMVEQRMKEGKEVFAGTGGDLLAFRIPSSEIHSAVSARVVGFFEPMTLNGVNVDSNMIVVPTDLMPIIGHDYDIDSFFTLQRQSARDDSGVEYFPGYKKNKDGMLEFDEGLNTDDFNDREFEAFHKNNIIESFLTGIERKGTTRNRMVSPISFRTIEEDIEEIEKITNPNRDKLDLSNPLDNYKAFESSFSGAQGVGVFANAMKSLAYSLRSNKGTYPKFKYKDNAKEKEPRISHNGKVLDTIDEKKGTIPNLWMLMDAFLNAAIDNVKVQILPKLNIGDNTFKAFIASISMGVDMKTANRFMLQPALRALSSLEKRGEVNNKLDKLISSATEVDSSEEYETIELKQEELEKWLKYAADNNINNIEQILASGNKEFIDFQAKMARAFLQLDSFGQSITQLSRYLSIIKELPVTSQDMKRFMDNRAKIINDDGTINEQFRIEMPDFFKKNPHVAELDKVLTQFWGTIQTNFAIHSQEMEEAIKKVMNSARFSGLDEEVYDKIKIEYQKYILGIIEENEQYRWDNFSYEDIPETTNYKSGIKVTGKDAFALHMARAIEKARTELNTNKFINFLSVATTRAGAFIQMHGTHNMEYEDYLMLREHFNELSKYEYDFETGELVKRKNPDNTPSSLQKHFVRYAMAEYGLKFGTKNFSLVFPPEIFLPLDKMYTRAINDHTFRTDHLREFILQLSLANADSIWEYKGDILEHAGYSPLHNVHYDLKLKQENSPNIIRLEDRFNGVMEQVVYIKVAEHEGEGSYYQKVGRMPDKWYYHSPKTKPITSRFRSDIKNYKADDVNKLTFVAAKQGIEPGSIVSATNVNDLLRTDVIFFEVISIKGDKAYIQRIDDLK